MTIGQRIKKVREFRGMSQKEFGLALGYAEKSAAIRIAQYESNTRVPKKDTIIEMARILECYWVSIYIGTDLGPAEYLIHQLFWVEELLPCTIDLFSLEKYYAPHDDRIMFGKYNDWNYFDMYPPIAMCIGYSLINDFLAAWLEQKEKLKLNQITKDEYFEWKINFPFIKGSQNIYPEKNTKTDEP